VSRTALWVQLTLFVITVLASCATDSQEAQSRPGTFHPSVTPPQTTFYLDRSALAYGVFETEAGSVVVDVSNTTPNSLQPSGDISIDDGTGVTTYKIKAGESAVLHSMPPGLKRVRITSGGQMKYHDEIRGVFITRITFDGPAVQMKLHPPRVVIYGDSITMGGNVDHPSAEAWPVLLREHFSVIVDAYSYRTLFGDANTVATRSAFAANVSKWTPEYVWLAIGTNDYESALWSAEEFGVAYAAILDALHSSNPQALLFAQTPILRAIENENSLGDTLEDYRQQTFNACLARSPWCVFVDGKAPGFPQLNELDKDGVHLTASSSVKYMETVLQILTNN
jgi:lysophospholipase L1-like esterase